MTRDLTPTSTAELEMTKALTPTYVTMPFEGGTTAMVAPDGTIVMEWKRDLTPTSTAELDILFQQYMAMVEALLAGREFSYTHGNVAEWQRWAFYATRENGYDY